ncbi:MAG: BMP family ABC transporter substrate-binding protein [Clostridia bacterium]|nr:BMP family ABC transporter substrate-binding protein [Clostridia bacterium]
MKKLLAIVLAALMLVPVLAACQPANNNGDNSGKIDDGGKTDGTYKVAMITDYGDITDESFNQTTYEACKEYCEANKISFKYYKPAGDSTPERVDKVEEAIDAGYNVIVMPGFAFAETVYAVQDKEEYKDVKFIALDVSKDDVFSKFYTEGDMEKPLIDENNKPHVGKNVYCAVYKEELCGYMAGYAAVKLGYKHLGFLGGMAVPAVIRYGYGFVQGCDAAAAEMGIADQVSVEYVYGNKFAGDPAIAAYMDIWYQTKGVEVVFACGGGIYTSAVEAAKKANGKVIGVDVDQAAIIKTLSKVDGMTVTSAMKGLGATVKNVLNETIKNDKWASFGGNVEELGLVSGTDPELNYVQIPMKSTQWKDGAFTIENYKELVSKMFKGEIKVSSEIGDMPGTTITVNKYDDIL